MSETPEGDEWTPVTHKRQSPRRLSLPRMQGHTIKTQNPLYGTSNVAVFAPVGAKLVGRPTQLIYISDIYLFGVGKKAF